MSLVEQVGAEVAAAVQRLPVAPVVAATQRLAAAGDLLRWVRRESAHDLGTATLAGALEHLEAAGRALLVAQERLGGYLREIGLAHDAGGTEAPRRPEPERVPAPGPSTSDDPGTAGLGNWWAGRIAVITGEPVPGADPGTDGNSSPDQPRGTDSPADLLRRVAGRVRDGGRGALAGELGAVPAQVGLGLAALSPAHAYDLCADLLGHRPTGADLARLTGWCRDRVHDLLPGLPPEALAHQLARVCRTPPPDGEPVHPVDAAATGAVLVGVLLYRLGRGGDALATEPGADRAPAPTSAAGRSTGARHA